MIVASLKWLEYGRVEVTVRDGKGLQIDKFIGSNPDDALSQARAEYKIDHVGNVENYTHPNLSMRAEIDAIVDEIEEETEELRQLGLLAPFIEGTPIGTIPIQNRADLKRKRKGKR